MVLKLGRLEDEQDVFKLLIVLSKPEIQGSWLGEMLLEGSGTRKALAGDLEAIADIKDALYNLFTLCANEREKNENK